MRKILVVDDEDIITSLLKDKLESQGYEVLTAVSGLEGIRKAEHFQPDLILMDINMPELDGINALNRLKCNELTRDISVILLSVEGAAYEDEGLRLGAHAVLKKPLDFRTLDAKIREAEQHKTVLVIDDNQDILTLVEYKLKNLGYDVICERQALKAVEKAKKEKPDLILLDLVLPGKNGNKLIKELKQDKLTADIPVIAFSGYISDELHGKKILGADKFIGKMFTLDELVEEITLEVNNLTEKYRRENTGKK
jgi:CheY-like chemotaxis protein